jgi:hypothetical protein
MCNQEKELMPDDYDTCNSCMFGEQDWSVPNVKKKQVTIS